MGPVFIKLGQFTSVMAESMDPELGDRLHLLCDKVEPFGYCTFKKSIEAQFKCSLEEIFLWINENHSGAASIAQVHQAVTRSGAKVAVKVLRPNIEKIFRRDLRILRFVVFFLSIFLPKNLRMKDVLHRFSLSVENELDLRMEAAAASEIYQRLANDPEVIVPEVFWEVTGSRVMTMRWIEGIPLSEYKRANSRAAKNLVKIFFKQVYREGFFHGDIHPGNVMITHDDRIALIDFGIIGRIPDDAKIYLLRLIRGLLERDYDSVAELHCSAGYVRREFTNFSLACRAVSERIIGKPAHCISISELLSNFFFISKKFELVIDPSLVLLQKNLIFLEKEVQSLDPDLNTWELITPMVKHWYKKEVKPTKLLQQRVRKVILSLESYLSESKVEKKNNIFFWIWIASVVNFLCILAFNFFV